MSHLWRQLAEGYASAMLGRTFDSNPRSNREEAVKASLQMLQAEGRDWVDVNQMNELLTVISDHYDKKGILNPNYLEQTYGYRFHFFLVNAPPGWLRVHLQSLRILGDGISRYVLYGEHDSLIVFVGTDEEAADLADILADSVHNEIDPFSAAQVLRFHRYEVQQVPAETKGLDAGLLNGYVSWDHEALESLSGHSQDGYSLGPAWLPRRNEDTAAIEVVHRTGLEAYVGISLSRGGSRIDSKEVLEALTSESDLDRCIIHCYQIKGGLPFHYLLKVRAINMGELDSITDKISAIKIGRARFEGMTFVVARTERCAAPMIRGESFVNDASILDVGMLEDVVQQAMGLLSAEAIVEFNLRPAPRRLAILSAIEHLGHASMVPLNHEELATREQEAQRMFGSCAVVENPDFTGPFMHLFPQVEKSLRNCIAAAIELAYDGDKGLGQKEMGLSTAKTSKLTWGEMTKHLLPKIVASSRFERLRDILPEWRLNSLVDLGDERNTKAHAKASADDRKSTIILDASRQLGSCSVVLRWIQAEFSPALLEWRDAGTVQEQLSLQKPDPARRKGAFLSHSSNDKSTISQIANVLSGLGFEIWYDEWEIDYGDSIVGKINEGLSRHDCLIVALSRQSVDSEWVSRELSAALMSQLAGEDVKVLPIKLDDCDIPPLLRTIKYIDLSKDFQAGILELIEFLRRHKF